eukprot:6212927-Pleurochrysis_carterae.AAC.7
MCPSSLKCGFVEKSTDRICDGCQVKGIVWHIHITGVAIEDALDSYLRKATSGKILRVTPSWRISGIVNSLRAVIRRLDAQTGATGGAVLTHWTAAGRFKPHRTKASSNATQANPPRFPRRVKEVARRSKFSSSSSASS